MCCPLLSWTTLVLLVASGPLLAHPITDPAESPYTGLVSEEDGGAASPDELSFSEQTYLPQAGPGLSYSSFMSGEFNRDGLRTTGLLPRQVKRESLLNPWTRLMGLRKQFKKRGGNGPECFWKYCV